MRIPEPLFPLINPVVGVILRSPLHFVLSSSVLLMGFRGRKSGREIRLPLRYARRGDAIDCFTTDDAKWWRNFETPRPVDLMVAGKAVSGLATAARVAPGEHLDALRTFLTAFPADALHHGVSVRDGIPNEHDLVRATMRSIRVRIH